MKWKQTIDVFPQSLDPYRDDNLPVKQLAKKNNFEVLGDLYIVININIKNTISQFKTSSAGGLPQARASLRTRLTRLYACAILYLNLNNTLHLNKLRKQHKV